MKMYAAQIIILLTMISTMTLGAVVNTPEEKKELRNYYGEKKVHVFDVSPLNMYATAVEYVIDSSFNNEEMKTIKAAMNEIQRHTCIKFFDKNTNGKSTCYLHISLSERCNASGECTSESGSKANIHLSRDGALNKGHILHELMHILGFGHEQKRPDRDQYVSVHMENVLPAHQSLFQKDREFMPLLVEDFPYDYFSVMHLTHDQYSNKQQKDTISSKNPKVKPQELGQSRINGELSQLDIMKIRILHHCTRHLTYEYY